MAVNSRIIAVCENLGMCKVIRNQTSLNFFVNFCHGHSLQTVSIKSYHRILRNAVVGLDVSREVLYRLLRL